jgi:hypothetical protein
VFVLIVGLSTFLEPVAPGQNATTIRSSSSLVLVPVSALDKSGNFVADLSAHDFQIFVDGQAVEVASFDAVREVSPPSARNPGPLAALPPIPFETSPNSPRASRTWSFFSWII